MPKVAEYKEPVPGSLFRKWTKLRKKHSNKSKQLVIAIKLNVHRNTISDAFGNKKATPTMQARITQYLESLDSVKSSVADDGN